MKVNLPINTTSKKAGKELIRMLANGGEYSRQTNNGFVCQVKGLMSKVEDGKLYVYQTDKQMWVEV